MDTNIFTQEKRKIDTQDCDYLSMFDRFLLFYWKWSYIVLLVLQKTFSFPRFIQQIDYNEATREMQLTSKFTSAIK